MRKCASALIARAVKRGDRVIIYADNTYEFVVALWAGGVFVIVNPQTKSDELDYIGFAADGNDGCLNTEVTS